MTAVNVVCQKRHNCLHVLTDGATYTNEGVLVGLGTKVFTEPNWPGVIAGRGSAIAVPLLGTALSLSFATFDALIDNVETVLEGMVKYYCIKGHAELIIAGFSEQRGGPESYLIKTSDELPFGIAPEEAKASGFVPDAFKLLRLPDMVNGPVPQQEIVDAAVFEGFTTDDEPAFVVAGLAKLIEIQRHSIYEDGIHWIGGYAQLTTINVHGVHQRILQRWPEDRIGELMKPAPIDWENWQRPPTSPNVVPFTARVTS